MNTPLKPALALTLLLSTASCSVSRHVVSETHEEERVQEVQEFKSSMVLLDTLSSNLDIQLDTVEIVIHDTVVVVKAQKMALSKQTQSSTQVQQVQTIRDTVYVEKVVEVATTEDVEQVSTAKPPNLTLIIVIILVLLITAAFLYKKLSG